MRGLNGDRNDRYVPMLQMNQSKKFFIGYENFKVEYKVNLDFTVWYPSEEQGVEKKFLRIFSLTCKEKSPPAEYHKFPLVIISHGSGGTKYDQLYLVKYLVSIGFIVITIQHKTLFQRISGLGNLLDRADAIHCSIDWCMEQLPFCQLINREKVYLVGFSAGGFSSLMVAGVRPDFMREKSFQAYSNDIKKINYSWFYNNKVKKIVLLAPALTHLFPCHELKKLALPVLLISASDDSVVGKSFEHCENNLKNLVSYLELKDADHDCFNDAYPKFMTPSQSDIRERSHEQREQLHSVITKTIVEFLIN